MLLQLNRMRAVLAAGVCALALFCGSVPQAAAYAEVTAEIPIVCEEVSGDKAHDYRIEILGGEEDVPMPEDDHLTVAHGETGTFRIAIAEPGTYKYTVKEIIGDEEGVEYDTSVYDVTIFATNGENDELTYVVSAAVAGTDEKPDKIRFSNGTEEEEHHSADEDNSQPERDGTGDNDDPNGNAFTGSGGITVSALFLTLILLFVFRKRDNKDDNEASD